MSVIQSTALNSTNSSNRGYSSESTIPTHARDVGIDNINDAVLNTNDGSIKYNNQGDIIRGSRSSLTLTNVDDGVLALATESIKYENDQPSINDSIGHHHQSNNNNGCGSNNSGRSSSNNRADININNNDGQYYDGGSYNNISLYMSEDHGRSSSMPTQKLEMSVQDQQPTHSLKSGSSRTSSTSSSWSESRQATDVSIGRHNLILKRRHSLVKQPMTTKDDNVIESMSSSTSQVVISPHPMSGIENNNIRINNSANMDIKTDPEEGDIRNSNNRNFKYGVDNMEIKIQNEPNYRKRYSSEDGSTMFYREEPTMKKLMKVGENPMPSSSLDHHQHKNINKNGDIVMKSSSISPGSLAQMSPLTTTTTTPDSLCIRCRRGLSLIDSESGSSELAKQRCIKKKKKIKQGVIWIKQTILEPDLSRYSMDPRVTWETSYENTKSSGWIVQTGIGNETKKFAVLYEHSIEEKYNDALMYLVRRDKSASREYAQEFEYRQEEARLQFPFPIDHFIHRDMRGNRAIWVPPHTEDNYPSHNRPDTQISTLLQAFHSSLDDRDPIDQNSSIVEGLRIDSNDIPDFFVNEISQNVADSTIKQHNDLLGVLLAGGSEN